MAVQTKKSRRATKQTSKRRAVEAIFEAEGLPGWLGWGTMGAESTYGSNNPGNTHYFGLIESSYAGVGSPNANWEHDAEISAGEYKKLVEQYGSVAAAVPHYSGGNYTASHVEELGKPKGAGSAQGGVSVPVADWGELGTNPGKVFGEALGEGVAAGNPLAIPESLLQAGSAVTGFLSMLTDIHFWIRVGEAIAALILIYMGLHSLTGQGPSPSSVAQTATAAATVK